MNEPSATSASSKERKPPENSVVDEETGETWLVDPQTGQRTRRWHPSSWMKVDFVRQECADAEAAATRPGASAEARAAWEQLAYVATWARLPFVARFHDLPNWRTLLNNSGLKKEVSEAFAMVVRVEQLVDELCGGDYSRAVVFDVCCGKGYLGTTLAALHPELQVRLCDRNGKINFGYLRELPNAVPTVGNILKPGDWLARWVRAEVKDVEDVRAGRPSRLRQREEQRRAAGPMLTRRALRAAEYHKRRAEFRAARSAAEQAGVEFVPPTLPSLHSLVLKRAEEQRRRRGDDGDDDGGGVGNGGGVVGILVGIHLCGLLSQKLVDTFNEEECIQGLVLCPCCLASHKISDAAARSRKLMSSGTADNYVYWSLMLYNQVRRDCRRAMLVDSGILSQKNSVIVARKRPAVLFDEQGRAFNLSQSTLSCE